MAASRQVQIRRRATRWKPLSGAVVLTILSAVFLLRASATRQLASAPGRELKRASSRDFLAQIAVPGSESPAAGSELPKFSLPGFRPQPAPSPLDPETAGRITGLEPAWLKSFGLVSVRLFGDGRGRQVAILEMIDAAGAYGLLTLWAPPAATPTSIGQGGFIFSDRMAFWKASRFFLLWGADAPTLQQWAVRLASQLHAEAPLPAVAKLLPRQGLQPGSLRFFVTELLPADGKLGEIRPLLHLDKSVQAVLGRYGNEGQRVIVLGYPTQALALEVFRQIEGYVQDKSHAMYAKRTGAILALTEDISRERALALLEEIRYAPSVKWIAGTESIKTGGGGVRSLLNAVVGSLALSFFFVIVTAMLGTIFGVYRFYLRIWRPDNFFDRPERTQMVRLKIVDR